MHAKCLWLLLRDNGRVEDLPKMFAICPFSGHNLPTHVLQNTREDRTTRQRRGALRKLSDSPTTRNLQEHLLIKFPLPSPLCPPLSL